MYSKLVILAIISLLAVSLIYSSSYSSFAFAAPKHQNFDDGFCTNIPEALSATCCWNELVEGPLYFIQQTVCQTCSINLDTGDFEDCGETFVLFTRPTTGEGGLPQDGVLEQLPTQGVAPPTRGQSVLPQDEGVLQQPTDEGAAPRIVEPPPPTCAPGSVLDPDINECVLENPPELCPDGSIPQPTGPGGTQPECPSSEAEQPGAGPVAEEEQEESAPEEEQQQSEEDDGSSSSEDDSDNNDN